MTQISRYPISKKVYERILEIFLEILVKIKTKKEAERFLQDFLTPTEKIVLAKRLAIAFLLEKNYDQRAIAKILRVSTATVSRVNLIKKLGGKGYQKMINRLLREEKVKEFLLKAGESLAEIVGTGKGKGTSSWRYLRQELEKKRKEKPF